MSIPSQVVDLNLLGGLAEKEDSVLTQHPTQLKNCLYRKTGAISKRYGFDAAGPYNKRLDGATPPTGELLATFGDELLRVGAGGDVDTFQVVNATSDWVFKDRVSDCVVTERPVTTDYTTTTGLAGPSIEPSVAYANGYIATVYMTDEAGDPQVTVDVINATTGAVVVARRALETAPGLVAPKIASAGTMICATWLNSSGVMRACFLNTTTMTWGTPGNGPSCNSVYDIDGVDSTTIAFACTDLVSGDVLLGTLTTGFGLVVRTLAGGGTQVTAISLRYVAGERVWLARALWSGTQYSVTCRTFTTAMLDEGTVYNVVAPTTPPAFQYVLALGIERLTATRAIVIFGLATRELYWNEVVFSAPSTLANAYGTTRRLFRAQLMSRPFVNSGRAYALILNLHSTHASHFLIDLRAQDTTPASSICARIEAVILPRQLDSVRNISSLARYYGVSNVANPSTGDFYIATIKTGGVRNGRAITLLRAQFGTRWQRSAAALARTMTFAGGCVSGYDRNETHELGFAYEPDIVGLSAFTTSGSGSMDQSAVYQYRFCFAWADAQGCVHRSAPSAVVSITTGASGGDDRSVTVYVPQLTLTNKDTLNAPGSSAPVWTETYRTEGGQSTFYLRNTTRNNTDDFVTSFVDTMSDATLLTNAVQLYTTGSVKPNYIPPSASIAFVWKNALFLAGTDTGHIWISKEILDGDGVSFNSDMVLDPFDGGAVTALATLDGSQLVIFKADSIWYVMGEPPDDTGSATLTTPQRIQSDVGCIDAASIVSTADGIVFYARSGLCLLNRGMQVVPIGRAVESSYVPYNGTQRFAGAVLLPTQGLARFVQYRTYTKSALNWDYYHSGEGGPVWSTDYYQDPVDTTDTGEPVACTLWRGAFVWLSATGYLYQETSAHHLDGSRWNVMSFTTAVEKSTGPQGFHRVRRVNVLGAKGSDHGLSVTLTSDLGTQARAWTDTEVNALAGLPTEQVQVHSQHQKVQRMSVTVTDSAPVSVGNGAGLTLRAISLEVAVKPRLGRKPAANKK